MLVVTFRHAIGGHWRGLSCGFGVAGVGSVRSFPILSCNTQLSHFEIFPQSPEMVPPFPMHSFVSFSVDHLLHTSDCLGECLSYLVNVVYWGKGQAIWSHNLSKTSEKTERLVKVNLFVIGCQISVEVKWLKPCTIRRIRIIWNDNLMLLMNTFQFTFIVLH